LAVSLQGQSEIIDTYGEDALNEDPNSLLFSESWSYRKVVLGSLAAQGSGFLSAYSAFRSSVPRFQKEDGRYLFLGPRESIPELMASPFRFDHLLEPSAAIPLGLLAGGVGYLISDGRSHHHGARWTMSGDDFLFTGAEAWNAGVTEEAVFRGWLYPLAYQYTGRNFWLANGAQALLFGAAHFDSDANPIPWPQAALGFYFGWLVEKNGWSLSESIFVHAWWDMLLFAGEVATSYRDRDPGNASFRIDLPVSW
jgi:membrane protease YdiL (CAAX protease family)